MTGLLLLFILGGYGGHGGYKKEEIKTDSNGKKGKAKKGSKKAQGAAKEQKADKDAAKDAAKEATKDAAKEATKDAAKEATKDAQGAQAQATAVPKPGQQPQTLNWGNVQLAAGNQQAAPAAKPSEVMDESQGGGVKNWWKVGDGHVHWGHDHWGSPHHVHHGGGGWEYGHTGMKHAHGHFRDEVSIMIIDNSLQGCFFLNWLFLSSCIDVFDSLTRCLFISYRKHSLFRFILSCSLHYHLIYTYSL